MADPEWRRFEQHVQQLLHLDSTPGSGSQFYARGDAVDNRHPADSQFAIVADCKYTQRGSFSLNHDFLVKETEDATLKGKRFALPLRFHTGGHKDDFVVLSLDDFAELLELARPHQPGTRDPDNPQGVRNGMESSGHGISGVDRLPADGGDPQ